MERLIIEGGRRLQGTVPVHGAKNGVLPLMAATLLVRGSCRLTNCPRLTDVTAAARILTHLGCRVALQEDTVTVDAAAPCRWDVPDGLMREMRSSIVFLGAILARCGQAELTFPGGCELGPRPIDLHLSALRALGARISESGGRLCCRAPGGLRGAEVTLPFPSVGATENLLIAAAAARGETVIRGAAREPEIGDLCEFLRACGAGISRRGDLLTVEGGRPLTGCAHRVIPDRIEAATYLAAAAVTGGRVTLRGVEPDHMAPVLPAFREAGCRIWIRDRDLTLAAPPRLGRIRGIRTMPYPGFPTDAAPPVLAMCCTAGGTSLFVETIFENRYRYAGELARMGARIKVEDRVAVVEGVPRLAGAAVDCTDLRGGAALTVAALAAEGTTSIGHLQHIRRGYADLEQTLGALGARITRTEEENGAERHGGNETG